MREGTKKVMPLTAKEIFMCCITLTKYEGREFVVIIVRLKRTLKFKSLLPHGSTD